MKNKQQIEQEADKTLNSLDGIKRAEANPYLFTRIKAALQKEEKSFWSKATGFIGKPVIAIAAIILVLLINVAVFFQSQPPDSVQSVGQNGEQLFASEYNLSGTTIYDATIDQQ